MVTQQQLQERRAAIEQIQEQIRGQKLLFTQQQLRKTTLQQRQQAQLQSEEGRAKALERISKELEQQKAYETEFETLKSEAKAQQKKLLATYREQVAANKRLSEAITKTAQTQEPGVISGKIISEYNLTAEQQKVLASVIEGRGKAAEKYEKKYGYTFYEGGVYSKADIDIKPEGDIKTEEISKAKVGDLRFQSIGEDKYGWVDASGNIVGDIVEDKPSSLYQRAERRVSSTLLKAPPIKFLYEKAKPFGQLSGITAPSWITPISSLGLFKTPEETQFQAGLTEQLIKEPIEKPIKTIGMVVVGYGGSKVTSFLGGKLGKSVLGKVLGTTAKLGLTGLYVGSKGYQIYKSPTSYEKGKVVGGAISGEILPLFAGVKLSQYDRVLLKKFLVQQKALLKDVGAKAGKSKTKTKTKQELVYRRKFSDKSDMEIAEEILKGVESKYKTDGIKGVQAELKRINSQLTSEQARINFNKLLEKLFSKGLISSSVYNTNTGKLSFYSEGKILTPSIKTIDSQAYAPTMVGGLGLVESQYAGKGKVFEEVQYISKTPTRLFGTTNILSSGTSTLIKPSTMLETKQLQLLVTGLKTKQLQLSGTGLKTKQLQELKELQKLKEEQRTRQTLRIGQISFLETAQTTAQKQALKQKYIQDQVPRQIPKPRLKPKPKPRIGYPYWYIQDKKRRLRERKLKKSRGLFIPQIRRFGIWRKVSKPTTYEKAFRKAISKAEYTLGASVRLLREKSKKPIRLPISRRFRRAKRDPFTLVEKKKYRLDFPSEISEIQYFRNRGRRKW